MVDLFRQLTISQFEASLSTLRLCVERCPDAVWNGLVGRYRFSNLAFHTAIFADLYLSRTEDRDVFKAQPFHQANAPSFGDYEEFEDRPPVLEYERDFVVAYICFIREKLKQILAGETETSLAGPSGFSWRKCCRAELHVYNLRHVQHHAATLSLRLRMDAGVEIPWVGHGWRAA